MAGTTITGREGGSFGGLRTGYHLIQRSDGAAADVDRDGLYGSQAPFIFCQHAETSRQRVGRPVSSLAL